jgi:hypothetical protein
VSALAGLLVRELAPTPGRGVRSSCPAWRPIPILMHRIPLALLAMVVMPLITQEDTAATGMGPILGVVGVPARPRTIIRRHPGTETEHGRWVE